MRKWTPVIPVSGAYLFSAFAYSRLPESVRPDFSSLLPVSSTDQDALPRAFVLLMLPTMALIVWILLNALSRVRSGARPLPEWWINENTGAAAVKRFEPTFGTIVFTVTTLLALMHFALLGSLLGWPSWSYKVMTAIIGFGLVAAGNVMPRTKPNWIVGMRTKRTLTHPDVWSSTHRLLGRLMIVSGILVVLTSIVDARAAALVAIVGWFASLIFAYLLGTRQADKVVA
jgi:hypothetical protein